MSIQRQNVEETRFRLVHFVGTCEKKTAVQCQFLTFPAGETRFFRKSPLRSGSLFASTQKVHWDLYLSLLYILTLGEYSKFARGNSFLALGVCFPQPCSSAGCRFAASRSRLQYCRRIVSFPQQKKSKKCVVNWITLRSAFVREIPNPTTGPEHLEKEINFLNKILGSKREDRFSDPSFELAQNTSLVCFSYLLRPYNFCKPRGTCESAKDPAEVPEGSQC